RNKSVCPVTASALPLYGSVFIVSPFVARVMLLGAAARMQRLVGKLGNNVVGLSQEVFACVLVKRFNRGRVAFHHRARGAFAGCRGEFLQEPFGDGGAVRVQGRASRIGISEAEVLVGGGVRAVGRTCD